MSAELLAETMRVVAAPVPHTEWGWMLGAEFFCNAVGTGAFAVSAVAVLRHGVARSQVRQRTGALIAALLICAAPLLLLLHLGQPLRFWHLYVLVNPRSAISWGTFLLSLFAGWVVAHLAVVLLRQPRAARLSSLLGLPLALCTQGYTAFIVWLGQGRPLWDNVLIVPLFLLTALAAGIAAVVLVSRGWLAWAEGRAPGRGPAAQSAVRDEELAALDRLAAPLGWTLLAVLLLLLGLLGSLGFAGHRGLAALGALLSWAHVWAVLGVLLGLGTLLPVLLLFWQKLRRQRGSLVVACGCALIGALALRLTVLVSGQALPLF